MPSQAICHPPVSITWPSRRMSVLETSGSHLLLLFPEKAPRVSSTRKPGSLTMFFCRHGSFPWFLQAWNNGRTLFPGKQLCPFPVPVSSSLAGSVVQTHCTRQAEEDGAGAPSLPPCWLAELGSVEPMPPAYFMLTKSIPQSFDRLGALWMGSVGAGSWLRGKDVKHKQGWSCYQHRWVLPPPSICSMTLGLYLYGPFMPQQSMFAGTVATFTLRCAGAELLPWLLVSCSNSGPDAEGPAMDWSLVAGTADLLGLLGAHVHSVFLFPSVHGERRGETSSLEGQNILVLGLCSGRERGGSPATSGYHFSQGKSLPNQLRTSST